jgi:hypothetical protein
MTFEIPQMKVLDQESIEHVAKSAPFDEVRPKTRLVLWADLDDEAISTYSLVRIVIVRGDAEYGELVDRKGDKAENYFKLKQKIVRLGNNLINTGTTKEKRKDGVLQQEHDFTIQLDNETIHFTDQINMPNKELARIKFMERAPYYSFPCQGQGYRHMHFASHFDMSVEVPAADTFEGDEDVRKVLGFDTKLKKIPNWDEDKELLLNADPFTRLFNPRPFELKSATQDDEQQQTTDEGGSKKGSVDAMDTNGSPRPPLKRKIAGVWGSSNPPSNPYFVKKRHDGDEPNSNADGGDSKGSKSDPIIFDDDDDDASKPPESLSDPKPPGKEWESANMYYINSSFANI